MPVVYFQFSQTNEEVEHCIKLPCERSVTQISKQGHLEDVKKVNERDAVMPLRNRKEVPELPQESTYDSSSEKRYRNRQSFIFQMRNDAWLIMEIIEGVKDKEKSQPDKWVEVCRPYYW